MTTIQMPVWLMWLMLALTAIGFGALCRLAGQAGQRFAGWTGSWWRWWPLAAEHRIPQGLSPDCWYNAHEDCPGCDCACHENDPGELPPERSQEELGFTGEQQVYPSFREAGMLLGALDVQRERRPPWWEAEHRAAYESLGFEYPSGLVARVRELAS